MNNNIVGYNEEEIRKLMSKFISNYNATNTKIVNIYNKIASAIFAPSDSSGWYGPKAKKFEQTTLKPAIEEILKKNAEYHNELLESTYDGYLNWVRVTDSIQNVNLETIDNYNVTLNDYARDVDASGNVVMTLGTAEMIGAQENVLDKELEELAKDSVPMRFDARAFIGGNQGEALVDKIDMLDKNLSSIFRDFISTAKREVAAIEEQQKTTASNVAGMFGSQGTTSAINKASQSTTSNSTTNANTSSTMNSKRASASNVNSINDEYAPGIPKNMRDHIKMRIDK